MDAETERKAIVAWLKEESAKLIEKAVEFGQAGDVDQRNYWLGAAAVTGMAALHITAGAHLTPETPNAG